MTRGIEAIGYAVGRKQRVAREAVLKLSVLVERGDCPELFHKLSSLPRGQASRWVRERLERSLRRTAARKPTSLKRRLQTPVRELVPAPAPAAQPPEASASAVPAPIAPMSVGEAPKGAADPVRDPAQILLELAQNY